MNGESLPYGGREPTSGHAGSDTSRERAERDDRSGTTSQRQSQALALIRRAGPAGMTVRDLRSLMSLHHGQASGLLSVLHKDGRLVRLVQVRDRCKIYVTPEWAGDRAVEAHGETAGTQMLAEMYDLLNVAQLEGLSSWASDDEMHAWRERSHDVMRRYESTYGKGE